MPPFSRRVLSSSAAAEAAPPLPPFSPAETSCGSAVVGMDLSQTSNPSIGLEWTNARGERFSVENDGRTKMITLVATDQTDGAFPGGALRFRNVVTVRRA
eukprot:7391617-Prymnesium_polylepis.2